MSGVFLTLFLIFVRFIYQKISICTKLVISDILTHKVLYLIL